VRHQGHQESVGNGAPAESDAVICGNSPVSSRAAL
jgi:hypothetical protein